MDKQKSHKITHQEFRTIDPMLQTPEQNVEHNLAQGIEEMVPDPDDVPGGFSIRGSPMPDITEADVSCLTEQNLIRVKILSLRKK